MLIRTAASALALMMVLGVASEAAAQAAAYPTKPIRLIIGAAPGGGLDITARTMGPKLASALGQQIVIDNRGGAAGSLAAGITAKSAPDGHTVLFGAIGNLAVNVSIYKGLDYHWYGFVVAAGTPRPIITRLNAEMVRILNLPDIKEALFRQGLEAAPGTPGEFGAYMKTEFTKWAKVVADAGAKAN